MNFIYAVIGAGRQGTAAAYDMAKFGEAEEVFIGDKNLKNAQKSAERINNLLNKNIVQAKKVDVRKRASLLKFLRDVDSCVSAVPYYFNLKISKAALITKANICDLGGNTEIVKAQLKLDSEAKEKGISIIPDCGQVPGMGTTLCVYAMSLLDKPSEVYMWDGGLAQNPRPPFNYLLTFNIEGLTNEYAEPTFFLREGKLVKVEPLEELEYLDFPPPIGRLEAFTTGGGTSTAPWTFLGKLKVYQNKTVRYPGHFAQLRAWWDLGLFDLNSIKINGTEIVPRKLLHALLEPKVTFFGDKDLVVIRIKVIGEKDGMQVEFIVELIDYYDDATGFTSMERTTGWDASIVAIMMAHGKVRKGAIPVELAIPGDYFISELKKRGFNISVKMSNL